VDSADIRAVTTLVGTRNVASVPSTLTTNSTSV
jgi:hypothetical protein